MKCTRIPMEAEVMKYELGKGLEDGFELFSDIVTKGWIITDKLLKVVRDNGSIVCPYIRHRRGVTFIQEGDYVIVDSDGTKQAVGGDKVFTRYKPVE